MSRRPEPFNTEPPEGAAEAPEPLPPVRDVVIRNSRSYARATFLAISGGLALAVLVWAREVLLPFVLAIVVAYVLTPAVARMERWRMPRWGAVLSVYALSLGLLYASMATVAPRLAVELRALVREAPRVASVIRDERLPAFRQWWVRVSGGQEQDALDVPDDTPPPSQAGLRVVKKDDGSYVIDLGPGIDVHQISGGHWRVEPVAPPSNRPFQLTRFVADAAEKAVAYGQRNTLEVIRLGRSIVLAVSRTIFLFFMTMMLAAYMMLTRERIVGFFRSLVRPAGRRSFDLLLLRIDRGLSGVVRGQLLICLVNGLLSAVGFWALGLKYWPILSIVAAVMSLIPIFGSVLSSVPIVAIALTQSFGTALSVLLFILAIHQLEANFLNPKIIGDAAKIHPVLVVFSLLVGEHFFALPGALLAVPAMSIVQSLFLHGRNVVYGEDAPPDSFLPPPPA